MKHARILIYSILALLLATIAPAQDCYDYETAVGIDWAFPVSGGVEGVAVSGDIAFIVNDYLLRAVDISEETGPQQIDAAGLTGDGRDVVSAGDFVFVAGRTYIEVFDVSNPGDLAEVFSLSTPALKLAIEGDRLYVASENLGLQIFLVNIDGSLSPLGAYAAPTPDCDTVDVQDDIAFIEDGNNLLIIDAVDPNNPLLLGQLDFDPVADGIFKDIVAQGGLAFALLHNGLHILDISDPTAPIELSVGDELDPFGTELDVLGDYAYITHMDGIYVYDVSSPTSPMLHSEIHDKGNCHGVASVAHHTYFGSQEFDLGLIALTTNDMFAPDWLGEIGDLAGSYLGGFDVSGDLALVTKPASNFHILDVSDPSNPVLHNSIWVSNCRDVVINGDFAYVSNRSSEYVRIFDISTPFDPIEVGSILINSESDHMELHPDEGLLYIATYNGLVICDVSTPDQPELIGSWTYGVVNSFDITVWNGYAYIIDMNCYLWVVDVTDPSAPVYAHNIMDVYCAQGLESRDGILYLPLRETGFGLYDLSDPVYPSEIVMLTGNVCYDVALDGDFAYVAADEGMLIYNISDPYDAYYCGLLSGVEQTEILHRGNYVYAAGVGFSVALHQCEDLTPVDNIAPAPKGLALTSHPNPFNPTTTVRFSLAEANRVELGIYDISGRKLRVLETGFRSAGAHDIIWDGRDERGNSLPSGVYFARLSAGGQVGSTKLLLLK